MATKSKTNGHGSFLNVLGNNSFEEDNIDPMFKYFLEHLKFEGKSHILETQDGNNGLPAIVKYENEDNLSDFPRCTRSGCCHYVKKGKFKPKKRYINKKSKMQSSEIVDFSGFLESHIETSLAVESYEEHMSMRNTSHLQFDRSADLSVSLKNQVESNPADENYQKFLSCLKVQDGLMVFENNSVRIIYEGNEINNTAEGTTCSSNQELVLYESSQIPDLAIYEAGDKTIVPLDSYILSPFDLKLMAVLSKPYDQNEHEALWNQANYRKPVLRHKDLRSQCKSFSTRQMGFSYLDHFPDLARKLDNSDSQQSLALLRGLFFWLKNLCHEGAYQPWISASPQIVEDLDQDIMILPFNEKKVDIEETPLPNLIL